MELAEDVVGEECAAVVEVLAARAGLLLGEEAPSRGTIALDGKLLAAEPGRDRGVVFQRYSVFPHLTVLGNVLLGKEFEASRFRARLVGPARREAIAEARGLIAEGAFKEYYSALSGIVRTYVEQRFRIRAPEMTTEAFLLAVASMTVLLGGRRKSR